MEKFQNTVLRLAGTVGIILGFLSLLIGASVSILLRCFVILLARMRRPDLVGIMQGLSQMFALESYKAESSCNIILYFVFDGTISLDALRQQFVRNLMLKSLLNVRSDPYVRLRQSWAKYMGFIFWQWESDFRIEKHVCRYDYANPELLLPEGTRSEEDLRRITAPLLVKPFPPEQSPWELLLIENYKSSDNKDGRPQCVIALRIHHALADGISLLKMTSRLFDGEDADSVKATYRKLSLLRRIASCLLVALRGPYDLASKLFADCYDSKNCWYMVDKQRPKEYHYLLSSTIQVRHIKVIMKKYNVCYNAVIYSVTAGAMVKLMIEAGQKVPDKLSCLFSYPLPTHPEGLDNYVSSDLFAFRPILHASPARRLEVVSKGVQPARVLSTVPVFSHWIQVLGWLLPVKIIELIYHHHHVTLYMTSIPGPRIELNAMGCAKLVEVIPALGHLRNSMGAYGVMTSIGARQRISISVHRAIFEGFKLPSHFAHYVEQEIEQLLRLRQPRDIFEDLLKTGFFANAQSITGDTVVEGSPENGDKTLNEAVLYCILVHPVGVYFALLYNGRKPPTVSQAKLESNGVEIAIRPNGAS